MTSPCFLDLFYLFRFTKLCRARDRSVQYRAGIELISDLGSCFSTVNFSKLFSKFSFICYNMTIIAEPRFGWHGNVASWVTGMAVVIEEMIPSPKYHS